MVLLDIICPTYGHVERGNMPIAAASQVVSAEVMNASAITTIIGNINGLYSNVFTFVAVLVTFGGIVFPIALTRYQKKKLLLNQKQLTDLVKSEIAAAKAILIERKLRGSGLTFDIFRSEII